MVAAQNENFPLAVCADNAGSQGASLSMQEVARRLLAALQGEGYGNNVAVAGNSANVGVIREMLSQSNISSIQVR